MIFHNRTFSGNEIEVYILEKLEVFSLGTLDIKLNNRSINEYMSGKAFGLLCYLAMNSDKVLNREKLVELFWGNSDSEAAKYNLRYTLWTLRRIFKNEKAQDIIINVKNGCKISEAYKIITDVSLLDNLLTNIEKDEKYYRNITLEKIHSIYKGEFLEGFYLKNCPEFNDWVFYEREACQRKYISLLSGFSIYLKQNNLPEKCIDVYEEMIRMNPLQEDLYLNLIRLYIQLGDRNAALTHYEKCCKVLREELNIGPMQELQKVYQQIKNGSGKIPNNVYNYVKKTDTQFSILEHKRYQQYINEETQKKDSVLVASLEKNLKEVDYYWMSELIEYFSLKAGNEVWYKIPDYCLQDLSFINSHLIEKADCCNKNISTHPFTVPDIRLYQSMEKLLHYFTKEKRVIIGIEKPEWIDNKSFQWLQYYIGKGRCRNMEIIIQESSDERIRNLKNTGNFRT